MRLLNLLLLNLPFFLTCWDIIRGICLDRKITEDERELVGSYTMMYGIDEDEFELCLAECGWSVAEFNEGVHYSDRHSNAELDADHNIADCVDPRWVMSRLAKNKSENSQLMTFTLRSWQPFWWIGWLRRSSSC